MSAVPPGNAGAPFVAALWLILFVALIVFVATKVF